MAEASIRRNPEFRRFWIGESITMLGGSVRSIAIPLTAVLLHSEFTLGFARPLFNVNRISLRQRAVPGTLQGRVNASFAFLLWGLPPLGAAFGGTLASRIGMRECLFVAAAGVLGAALFIRLSPLRDRNA